MSSSGISVKQSDSLSALLNPQGSRFRHFFIRVFLPWLETRRLTRGLGEVVLSPEEREKQDADIAKFVEDLVERLKTQGRKEASVNHESEMEEIEQVISAEREDYEKQVADLKDLIVKQEDAHQHELQRINDEHGKQIEDVKNIHAANLEKSSSLPTDLIGHLLPRIELQRDSMKTLLQSNIRRKICAQLRILNDQPVNIEAQRFRGTNWMEVKTNWSARLYYKRTDGDHYHVLLGDKKSQPADEGWMKRN